MYHKDLRLFGEKRRSPDTVQYRENSLYWFVLNSHQRVLPGYPCEQDTREGREVIYIKLPVVKELPPIFAGFKCVEQHLSIDRWVKTAGSLLSRKFSPSHLTMIYDNANTRYFIHVYYNRHGQLIDTQIKTAGSGRLLSEAVNCTMENSVKALIYQHANQSQQLINELIQVKAETYSRLMADYHVKERELAILLLDLNQKSKRQLTLDKIDQIQATITTLNSYDDSKDINVSAHFLKLSQQLVSVSMQEIHPVSEILSAKSDEPTMENPSTSLFPIAVRPVISAQSAEQALMIRVENLVQQINTYWENTANKKEAVVLMQPPLSELNDAILELEFNHASKTVKTFIETQRSCLIFHWALPAYFQENMLQGNIGVVSELYDTIVAQQDMTPFFWELIGFVEKCVDSELVDKLTNVAEFFYQRSETYRSVLTCSNAVFSFSPEEKVSHGRLLRLFLQNNHAAFSFFLQQTTLPEDIQYLSEDLCLNALQAVILHFHINPNLEFIHTLLKHDAPMTILLKNQTSMMSKQLQLIRKNQSLIHIQRLPAHQIIIFDKQLISAIIPITNMFVLATTAAPFYRNIIKALLPHTDMGIVLSELSRFLTVHMFQSRLTARCTVAHTQLFDTPKKAEEYIKEAQHISGDNVSLMFICTAPRDGIQDELYATTQLLWSWVSDQLNQQLSTENRQTMMSASKEKARQFLLNKMPLDAKEALNAALLLNLSLQPRTDADDDVLLRLFCLHGDMVNQLGGEGWQSYKQGLEFLNSRASLEKCSVLQGYMSSKIPAEHLSLIEDTALDSPGAR